MTRSLGDELPEDKTQGIDPYMNKHECKSISRYG